MRINDTLVGAGFVVAGALIIAGTMNYPTLERGHPGPALFPRILGGLMVAFGGILSMDGLRAREAWAADWLRGRGLLNACAALGGILLYMAVVDYLGFLPTATLILAGLMAWLHVRPVTALLVGAALAVGIDLLFGHFLLVPLPRGPLGW
jgi:hypothetical protein